jgi:protein-tyrosine phosphatase
MDDAELVQPGLDAPVVLREDEAAVGLHWAGRAGKEAEVFASSSPAREGAEVVGVLRDGYVRLPSPRRERRFFSLDRDTGVPLVVAERRLPFDGHANFRDLGGYPGADGRRVRWGRLFRSGSLSELTDGDLELLKRLGLGVVCDFRSPRERSEEPHRFPDDSSPEQRAVNHEQLAGALNPDEIRSRIEQARLSDLDTGSLLIDGNAAFATTHRKPFATMLELVCERAPEPILVNCSAGKDRTGFASAVLLLALGVSREVIRHDYLLTNHYQGYDRRRRLEQIRQSSQADPEDLRPLLEARPDYIDAAFGAIDRAWGSDEAFLRDGLGLSAGSLAGLRAELLD